ncbi:monovalent cation/H+ antiporter subunit D [Pseudomarimonas salicorniae]|uniref:Monovalent cation/H+ antiporter subunit D n=1 Tax=Pseudomarimonas salicorniae TaxID=2933270 RepID=A0ABT0GL28_9GAMM|nr:monovalent cation/H+ antiporter subunit D [Lysobacter sp. CAU 1642]MCK7595097.1 monovalent cation/H+ antiporter subunit D [Lysobacter sp. CAU 1642]
MSAHLPVLPIVLPLLVAGALVLLEKRGIALQRVLGLASGVTLVVIAGLLAQRAGSGEIAVYLLGNWEARIGIALAVDRLAAIMLITTAVLGLAGLLYACSGWDKRAPHFHALFQVQLAGLNGAFLTADLFNLFVFFEVLLIASYGLMLSGGRGARLRAGIQYVAFNITASTLYLFAVGLLYGLLGALNMAELAERIATAPAENLPWIAAAGGLLLVVFCAKAALFPLALWLPETYTRTPAPVVALFAVMTKLGVYAVLRVYSVMFGAEAGPLAGYIWPWLLPAAGIGLALSALGALAAPRLRTLVAYLVVGSAATLFIAISVNLEGTLGAGLYYLIHSSFAAAALLLITDMLRRQRHGAGDSLRKLDHLLQRAALGILFAIAAVAIVGLPPLAGFIGKLALLAAMPEATAQWAWPLILISSLLALIALANAGSQLFWRAPEGEPDGRAKPARPSEWAAVGLLLVAGLGLVAFGGPVLRYTADSAQQLLAPAGYRAALLEAVPVKHQEVGP